MANIRVYEAARKLNIETSELMKMLEERNAPVKSPIAFISQSDFDDILNMLTSEPEGAPSAERPPAGEGGEGKVISITSGGEGGQKEQPARVIPFARVAAEEDEEKEKTGAQTPPPPAQAVYDAAKPAAGQSILSFLALGLASAAMLFALTLNSGVTKNTADIEKALDASNALRGEVTALEESVKLNKSMIGDNSAAVTEVRGRIEAVNRAQAKTDLLKRSDALEELSAAAPDDMALRLRSVSESLRQLAASL